MGGNGITTQVVNKLWGLCKTLQGAGVSYKDYVTELTYLLFLKMLEETKKENIIPQGLRWKDLSKLEGEDQLLHYRRILLDLGNPKNKSIGSKLVTDIYADSKTSLTKPIDLKNMTNALDQIDWFSAKEDGLGNLYEGLLERTTSEKKSKAGQYFTPRPLINCMVDLIKPQAGEVVQDPAAGTGGFLVAADKYIRDRTDDLFKLKPEQAHFQRHSAFQGAELVSDTYRLCLMNLLLHGIESPIECFNTLDSTGETLGKADVILTNPPFNKFPNRTTRSDFSVTAGSAQGPIPFLEHVIRALKPGGRAAVVLSDNVLFSDHVGQDVRRYLMDLCDLHTILRLPTGIFYAQGVKTNVLFFTRGKKDKDNTKAVWVYDMRANMPAFGKTRPLSIEDFADFFKKYGDDPNGKAKRKDEGAEGRFRCFTKEQIAGRNDNLDISWLKDDSNAAEDELTEPEDIAAAIMGHLRAALTEIEAFTEELGSSASDDMQEAA
jgi:type I restriction enzyme M protein